MSDEAQTPPGANQPEARTETGEIKDQQAAPKEASKGATELEPKPEEKKPTEKSKTEESKAPAGAPEKYEAFTVPEGYELNEKVGTEISALFKELNLPQVAAQKLVDFYAAKAVEAMDAPYKLYEETRNGWRDTIVKDPAIGNGTDNLKPEVQALIGKAIDSLPNAKEFREAMDLTGAGDNPAFVKAFYELAKRLPSEGTHVAGKGPSTHGQAEPGKLPRSAASALYPNLP